MENYTILLNPHSFLGNKIKRKFLILNTRFNEIMKKDDMHNVIQKSLSKNQNRFIVVGGDGTINNYINCLMAIDKKKRDKIISGFIPAGRANDFCGYSLKSNSIQEIKNAFESKKPSGLDIIKVNGKYFATGGGIGLVSDVVSYVHRLTRSEVEKFLIKLLGRNIYIFSVLKNMVIGYKGVSSVKINDKILDGEYMAVCVNNQSTIGRKFKICPDADNSDGEINICIINKPKSLLGDIEIFRKILEGQHIGMKGMNFIKGKSFVIKTKEKIPFTADGEILSVSDRFEIEVLHKELRIIIP